MHRSYGLQGSLKRRYKHPSPTSINGYHAAKKFLSQWPAKRSTFAFAGESGYTLAFANRIAHSGLHAETGAFRTGPLSLPSDRSARSQTSPGRVSERKTLPLLGLGREVLSKNAESLRGSDALMRVAVPRRRGPAGLRDLFSFLSKLRLVCPALRAFPCVRGEGWYHYSQRALRAAETPDGRLSKRLICRFLASPIYICESSRRALPISASIQIACCWISRGHIACPWLIQA